MDASILKTDTCWDTHCAVSCISCVLLLMDLYFDLAYILWPSKENAAKLCTYYKGILTPSLSPMPWPGYWFPPFTIYKLWYECPDPIFVTLSLLWFILAVRYHAIWNGCDQLHHWWTVVLVRVVMAILLNLFLTQNAATPCQFSQNIASFLGLTPIVLNDLSFHGH